MADKRLGGRQTPLSQVDPSLAGNQGRKSADIIYEAVMRGGGEPFGAPFEMGVPTLTERIVNFFKQRGFFAFETWEKLRPRTSRNKFTRHGAARFVGPYRRQRRR